MYITVATTLFVIGAYVYLHDRSKLVNQIFFLFTVSATLWASGFAFFVFTGDFYFNRVILVGGGSVVMAIYMFSYVFPNRETLSTKFVYSLVPAIAIFVLLIPERGIVTSATIQGSGELEVITGTLFPLYLLLLLYYLGRSFINFYKKYRKAYGKTRLQMRYFFFGLSFFFGFSFLFNVILPGIGISQLNPLGPAALVVLVFTTAYAIIRHQLMDIRVVIQLGLVYSVLLAIIVGTYLLFINLFGYALHITADIAILLAAGLTTILGIFTVPIIDQYLRKITDRFFFKDKYDFGEAIYELGNILDKNIYLEPIIKESSEKLRSILRAKDVDISLTPSTTSKPYINDLQTTLIEPIVHEESVRGYITVTEKRSGDPFSKEDRILVKTFSQQASVAIEKAQLFKEVEGYSEELEEKVKERTAQIKKLQEDQENMMVDISHGLQDPLTVAKMEVEKIRNKSDDIKEFIAFERSIEDISSFIYRLLHLTRLERGAVDVLELQEVNLSKLLEELVEYFDVLVELHDITILSFIEPNICVYGDEKSLEEMITNIVSNAIKYNIREIDDKKIYISLTENAGLATLTIEDTGIGIQKQDIPFIFNRFHRTKQNHPKKVKSTGLGLAITKQIVELHKGMISVKSDTDKGTIFTITIPCHMGRVR